jgi:hypothetical protein
MLDVTVFSVGRVGVYQIVSPFLKQLEQVLINRLERKAFTKVVGIAQAFEFLDPEFLASFR